MSKKTIEINLETLTYVVLALLVAAVAFNQYQISSISGLAVSESSVKTQAQTQTVDLNSFLPAGIPNIYGQELGVSFDDPVNSLNKLAPMDADLYEGDGLKYTDLTGEQLKRYVKIGSSIACEFCCGAKTLVLADGRPACGCSHSAAMRFIAKYLLKNHGDEFSDEQILEELTKWKTMFFPKQMLPRLAQQSGQQVVSTELPDMVGGC